jgi:sugar phosphate isomerase/epimerase
MKVGLVHFMAFPETGGGEGPLLETLRRVCEDDYFGAVEVTAVRDPGIRKEAAAMCSEHGMKVAFGAQPILLGGKLSLNVTDLIQRREATDVSKRAIDEAIEWGAVGVAFLSGPDPGPEEREAQRTYLTASLKELCEHSRICEGPPVLLEVFDRIGLGKNCLIGPTPEAVSLARHVSAYYPRFGLMIDLSHLPLLGERPEDALRPAAPWLRHAHIGNCVKRDASHPAYGDNHPMFGIPEGEVGVRELVEFLRVLHDIGYIGRGMSNIVSFEIKPFGEQTGEEVIANAKETLDAAWAEM